MTNKPKILGTTWETAVVNYLRDRLYPNAERRALSGGLDKGDIINAGPYVWECKNTKEISLASGMDEVNVEISNAKVEFGFLIVKRRRKSTGDAYAVMSLQQLCDLLQSVDPNLQGGPDG